MSTESQATLWGVWWKQIGKIHILQPLTVPSLCCLYHMLFLISICCVFQQLIYLFPPTEIVIPPSVWSQFVCTCCKLIVGFLVALTFMFKSQLSRWNQWDDDKTVIAAHFSKTFSQNSTASFCPICNLECIVLTLSEPPHVFTIFLWTLLTCC